MSAARDGAPPPIADRPDARRIRLVLAVLLAVFLASAVRNLKEDGDFRGYLEVGELVLQGRDIYADARPDVSTWPPLFSILCVPFALLARVSVYLARAVWLVLNALAVLGLLRLAVGLVYHRALDLGLRGVGLSIASLAVCGPLVLSSRFVLGNLDRLQINMIILLLCLAGAWCLTRGSPGRGGMLLGVAAAIKVLPVFFLPYLAWKRWWRALAAMAATGSVASVAPVLVFGPERFAAYVAHWLTIARQGWPVRKGNQSVYAMVDRLVSHGDVLWTPAAKRLTASGDPLVDAIVWGLLVLAVAGFAWAGRRGGRNPAGAAVTVEIAAVLAIATLFSPLAWKHYFVFLVLGYVVLWRAVFVRDGAVPGAPPYGLDLPARRWLGVLLGLAFVLSTVLVRGVVGRSWALVFETRSVITLGGLLVLAALLDLRARLGAGEEA